MRVTSVELHPAGSSEVCVLSFRDPTRQNPYNVKSIGGLDISDGIVPQFYGVSGSAASFYNLMMTKRDVAFQIELNPKFSLNMSYSDLRDDLYRMIASSRTGMIQAQFINEDGVVAAVSGFVTKVEAPLFVQTPEVIVTLSAVDPMLIALTETDVVVAGLDPTNTLIQDEVSTAPHGFSFVMSTTASFASLTITDPGDSTWSFAVTPSGGFLSGDALHFSSDPKNKQLYIVRGGTTIYLADVIAPASVWPIMFPGDNRFAFTNPLDLSWTSLSYYATYWGV